MSTRKVSIRLQEVGDLHPDVAAAYDREISQELAAYRIRLGRCPLDDASIARVVTLLQRRYWPIPSTGGSFLRIEVGRYRQVTDLAIAAIHAHGGRWCDSILTWCSDGTRYWTEIPTDDEVRARIRGVIAAALNS